MEKNGGDEVLALSHRANTLRVWRAHTHGFSVPSPPIPAPRFTSFLSSNNHSHTCTCLPRDPTHSAQWHLSATLTTLAWKGHCPQKVAQGSRGQLAAVQCHSCWGGRHRKVSMLTTALLHTDCHGRLHPHLGSEWEGLQPPAINSTGKL